mgnify:CR=1 FL=1
MTLDLPCLENFKSMVQHQGASVWFTVRQPDGTEKTIDINLVFLEVLQAIRALEHFTDGKLEPNPTGQERIG